MVVAIALGALGGVATVVFLRLLDAVKDLLWTRLPQALGVESTAWFFIVPVVLVGAVILGLARHQFGEYPVTIEQAIADHKRDGEFDYHHLWQAGLISVISLGFGAALGPEAALTTIIGGICSWVARVIDANTTEKADLSFIGISGALGGLFGTAGAAVLVLDPQSTDGEDARSGRLWRVIPGIAAAVAGLYIYKLLGSSDHYFDLGLPAYAFAASDLLWAVPVAVVSAVAALAFLYLEQGLDRLFAPIAHRAVVVSLIGGLGLAALGSWNSLMLFSGHEGVDTLVTDYGTDSTRMLLMLAVGKLAIAALMLSSMWKGGRFFPLMFVGAAIGLALSQVMPGANEVTALAAGMTAVVGVLIRRPLVAVAFMILFFPPPAWPVVIVAGILGAVVGTHLTPGLEAKAASGGATAA